MALVFTDPLVEAVFRNPEQAGYPASSLVSRFLAFDESAARLDRHAFADRFATALTASAAFGPEWADVVATAPVGYRMRALWRVLDAVYRGTGISGEPVA